MEQVLGEPAPGTVYTLDLCLSARSPRGLETALFPNPAPLHHQSHHSPPTYYSSGWAPSPALPAKVPCRSTGAGLRRHLQRLAQDHTRSLCECKAQKYPSESWASICPRKAHFSIGILFIKPCLKRSHLAPVQVNGVSVIIVSGNRIIRAQYWVKMLEIETATRYSEGNFANAWDLSWLHDTLLFKFPAPEDMWWHKQLTGIL